MKKPSFTNEQMIALGIVGVVALMWIGNRAAKAAVAVGQAVNPVNQDNIFYSGVSAVGEKITGDKHWTLGGQIYEWFN